MSHSNAVGEGEVTGEKIRMLGEKVKEVFGAQRIPSESRQVNAIILWYQDAD